MFQNNPALRKSFLKVGTWSSLTGILLAFTIRGSWFTRYMLIAITCFSIFVLLVWVLIIERKNHKLPSKNVNREVNLVIAYAILFLAIQYFLVGGIGNLILRYDEYAAINYCEQVGERAEEYKSLNGEYPDWKTIGLDEMRKPPLLIRDEYISSDSRSWSYEGPYCTSQNWKVNSKDYKVFYIPDRNWGDRSSR